MKPRRRGGSQRPASGFGSGSGLRPAERRRPEPGGGARSASGIGLDACAVFGGIPRAGPFRRVPSSPMAPGCPFPGRGAPLPDPTSGSAMVPRNDGRAHAAAWISRPAARRPGAETPAGGYPALPDGVNRGKCMPSPMSSHHSSTGIPIRIESGSQSVMLVTRRTPSTPSNVTAATT